MRFAAAAMVAICAVASLFSGPAEARRTNQDPWCTQFTGDNSFECSYQTFEQCMATIWGVGGICVVNPRYDFSAAPEPVRPHGRRR